MSAPAPETQPDHGHAVGRVGRCVVSKSYFIYPGLSPEQNFSFDLAAFLIERGVERRWTVLAMKNIDDFALLTAMLRHGGFAHVTRRRLLRKVCTEIFGDVKSATSASASIRRYYESQLYDYEHALVYGPSTTVQLPVIATSRKQPSLHPLGKGRTSALLTQTQVDGPAQATAGSTGQHYQANEAVARPHESGVTNALLGNQAQNGVPNARQPPSLSVPAANFRFANPLQGNMFTSKFAEAVVKLINVASRHSLPMKPGT